MYVHHIASWTSINSFLRRINNKIDGTDYGTEIKDCSDVWNLLSAFGRGERKERVVFLLCRVVGRGIAFCQNGKTFDSDTSIGDYGRSFACYQPFAKKVFFRCRLASPSSTRWSTYLKTHQILTKVNIRKSISIQIFFLFLISLLLSSDSNLDFLPKIWIQ